MLGVGALVLPAVLGGTGVEGVVPTTDDCRVEVLVGSLALPWVALFTYDWISLSVSISSMSASVSTAFS